MEEFYKVQGTMGAKERKHSINGYDIYTEAQGAGNYSSDPNWGTGAIPSNRKGGGWQSSEMQSDASYTNDVNVNVVAPTPAPAATVRGSLFTAKNVAIGLAALVVLIIITK